MDLHQTLIDAIRKRKILSFIYKGHPRTVEPHAYGMTTASNKALRCFQTEGTSTTGEVPAWKLVLISHITNLSVCEQTFANARDGYKPNDQAMRHIYVQL